MKRPDYHEHSFGDWADHQKARNEGQCMLTKSQKITHPELRKAYWGEKPENNRNISSENN